MTDPQFVTHDLPEAAFVQNDDPNVPVDRGLSSLGLVMQLAGTLFMAASSFLIMGLLIGRGSETAWIAIVGVMGITRSAFHRAAGSALVLSKTSAFSGSNPKKKIITYVAVALIHTILTIFAASQMKGLGMGLEPIPIAVMLMAWPVALLVIISLPRFRSLLENPIPVGSDFGLEGASAMMVLLGSLGAFYMAFVLYTTVSAMHGDLGFPGLVLIASGILLFIRSVLHAQAGFRGVTNPGSEHATQAASRYSSFGIATSFIVGALVLIMALMEGGMSPILFIVIGLLVWMLLAWPLVLKRFFGERSFAAMMITDGPPPFVRGPDAGMVGLGWLLFGLSIFGLSFILPGLVGGGGSGMVGKMNPLSMAAAGESNLGVYLQLGVSLLQLWAAIELISMSPRWKIAIFVYAGAGVVVAVHAALPFLSGMGSAVESMRGSIVPPAFQTVGPIVASLIIPIGSAVLGLRRAITSGVGGAAR